MAAAIDRAVGKVVHQEGVVAREEVDTIEPRQDHGFVLPRQLTRPSIQAMDSYGNPKNTVTPETSLQFQGFQEFITISPDNSPTEVDDFTFLLSDVNKDNHRDLTQQTISSYRPSQPSCSHSMQDSMMGDVTTKSNLMTQVSKAQAEKDSCNKWKNMRKPYLGKRALIRKAPQVIPDPVPERKRTAPINPAYTIRKSRVANSVHMRPYRDRVIHLLALKNYKKPELLLRLQKDGISQNDRNSLGKILEQVANLNTQDYSYTLKDYVFQELQRDWPGYSDLERQSLELVLSRKGDPFQNATGTSHRESSTGFSKNETSSSQGELFNSAVINCFKSKKVRISHLTAKVKSTSNGLLSNTSAASVLGHPPASEAAAKPIPPPLPTTRFLISNPSQPAYSNCSSYSFLERPETQDPYVDNGNSRFSKRQQGEYTSLETLPSTSIQMKYPKFVEKKNLPCGGSKYKFMEHKAKNQDDDTKTMEKEKTHRERQRGGAKPNSSEEVKGVCASSGKTSSASEIPDYLTNYVTIASSQQRQRYEQEFREDFEEYNVLYNKMLTLSSIFVYLSSKRKQFSQTQKNIRILIRKSH